MKLTTTGDPELNRVHALLYGNSGIGKTTSVKTLPEKGTLFATAEHDVLPLRKLNFPVIRFDCWNDIREVYKAIAAPTQTTDKALGQLAGQAKILVIDSLAQVSMQCMKHILYTERPAVVGERTENKRQSPKGIYEDVMTQEDWGLYGTLMLNLINAFNQLPIHTICLCPSAKPTAGQQRNCTYIPDRIPAISGRSAEGCMQLFGLIMHMQPGKTEDGLDTRAWRTYNDGASEAKDSSGELDLFEPANWKYIFKKLLGAEDYAELYGETQ